MARMRLTWEQVHERAGRNDMPALLFNHQNDMDDDELAKGIHAAWVLAEWPVEALDVRENWGPGQEHVLLHSGMDLWTEYLFERVGPLHNDQRVSEDELLPKDGEPLVVYRGAIPDLAVGMSWTKDRARAEWFARRFNGIRHPIWGTAAGHVYRMEVDPAVTPILAVFDGESGRQEDEVVLDVRSIDESWFEDLGEVPRIEYAV